jgi:hypothetical protein
MAVFLAGVANAEIFKGNDLFATAKTLIDSSITIGVSAEDIRAGQGAKLYGKYFHTSTFDLKMTDAMFRLEYIAANVGADLEIGGDVFTEEQHIIEAGDEGAVAELKLAHAVVPMTAGKACFVYYKKDSDSYYKTMPVDEGATTIEIADAVAGEIYCVKYLYNNDAARKLVVNANFTPDTLSVYLTANLYSGDATNPTTGTKIGTVTIKVPRFLLSGSQELSMSMTGASNTAFEGSALASKGKGCDNDGIYAEIIEVINERSFSDLVALVIEGQYEGLQVEKGEEIDLKIYGRFEDTAPALIPESKVDITPDGTIVLKADGVIKAGETDGKGTITVKVGSLEQKIDVTVGTGEPAGE